ncbi:hypothetical protein RQP46_006929 [Phenoliferia psychrophenolica]
MHKLEAQDYSDDEATDIPTPKTRKGLHDRPLVVDASLVAEATLTLTFVAFWTARRANRYLSAAQASLLCTWITPNHSPSPRFQLATAICGDARKTLAEGVAFPPLLHLPFPLVLLIFLALKSYLADRFVHSSRKDGPELALHLLLASVSLHLAIGSLLVIFPTSFEGWSEIAEDIVEELAEGALPWLLCIGGLAMLAMAAWEGLGKREESGAQDRIVE